MGDVFFELYKKESDKASKMAGIIGHLEGSMKILKDKLLNNEPYNYNTYTNEELVQQIDKTLKNLEIKWNEMIKVNNA